VLKSEGKASSFGAIERLDCKSSDVLVREIPDTNAQDVVPTQNIGEYVCYTAYTGELE